jgi:GT2 family glycosyltransferase
MAESINITAIVTAYNRIGQTLETLRRIRLCDPCPDELIVHVDGQQVACADAIREGCPYAEVITSSQAVGPGGGRNKLIDASRNELVASFDDDSYPVDPDYFQRVRSLSDRFPEACILGAAIYHNGETIAPSEDKARWAADFVGCGCVYRRSIFLKTSGYVPLPMAYGMEEVDLALRLLAGGKRILSSTYLRVYHATRLQHHREPGIVSASIANVALLAFLRYPILLWPLGMAQCMNRIRWLLSHKRFDGILSGICMIPSYLWSRRHLRRPLDRSAIQSYLELRRMQSLVGNS